MQTFLKFILFLTLLLVGISGIAFYWTFYRPLPDYNTTATHKNLNERVEIHWDTFGVPHIYAADAYDLYYTLGYVHAQDRLWQMTLTQIAAEGRFAEFFGKELLPLDQFQRTVGFWKTAKKIEQNLSEEDTKILQAYADGVNHYAEKHKRNLPIQFSLADMDPIPWKITHSLALARLMAWELNMAWKNELNYALLHRKLSAGQFKELFPDKDLHLSYRRQNREGDAGLSASLTSFLKTYRDLSNILGTEGSHTGSNAWAVDSSVTDTDFPLLAGDPHLGLNMPGKWYEVHLNLNGSNLSGATIAGAPAVILGQNDFLAWSLTNIMLDDTDFFQEAVNPENREEYVLDSLAGDPIYEPFTIQKEVIKIKDDDDTTFTRRLTKHGPVISNIHEHPQEVGNRVITMKWTGHEPSNEFGALLKMGWAESFGDFRTAARRFKVPGQNIIYADRSGNIARLTLADIPIRSGNPILLRKGWDPSQDWQSYIPFEELPHAVNPPKGWVANANNSIAPENYPYYITAYWEPESRYRQITNFLSENNILTSEAFQFMQHDTHSNFSSRLTSYILPVLKEDPQQFNTAISYLENWDFNYGLSETAASIMDVFLLRFSENIFEDEMGTDTYNSFIEFPAQPLRSISKFITDGSTFFDNINTPETEDSDDIIKQSMEEALTFLHNELGSEPFEWRWEKLHTLTLSPPLLGRAAEDSSASPALKLIVDNILSKGPYPVPGHNMSINNGEYRWANPYNMVLGASIRRIIDFSDMNKSLSILPTGQSENPLSNHYGDQTESWLNGEYKFLYQSRMFIEENQYQTMTFIPAE